MEARMAYSLSFLLSAAAADQRMSQRKPAFVVHIDTSGDVTDAHRFLELDASDIEHASNLVDAHCDGNARTTVRRVTHDGTLHDPCFIK
jgi:hypothetical protein